MHHGIPTIHFCDSQQRGSTINSELIDNQHCWLLIRGGSMINSQQRGSTIYSKRWLTINTVECWSGAHQQCWSLIHPWSTVDCWSLIHPWSMINSWLLIIDPPLINSWLLIVDPPPTVRRSTLSEQKLVSILVCLASQRTFPLGKSNEIGSHRRTDVCIARCIAKRLCDSPEIHSEFNWNIKNI